MKKIFAVFVLLGIFPIILFGQGKNNHEINKIEKCHNIFREVAGYESIDRISILEAQGKLILESKIFIQSFAQYKKKLFDSLLKEGFSEAQAIKIVIVSNPLNSFNFY